MTIHEAIRARREALDWSHQRLADEVTKLEGLAKPLTWQSVQQWEKTTAPKRSRLPFVAKALGMSLAELLELSSGAAGLASASTTTMFDGYKHDPTIEYGNEYLSPAEISAIVKDLRDLLPEDRLEWIKNLRRSADHNRRVREHGSRNRVTGKSFAASNSMTARISLAPLHEGDGNPRQGELPGVDTEADQP